MNLIRYVLPNKQTIPYIYIRVPIKEVSLYILCYSYLLLQSVIASVMYNQGGGFHGFGAGQYTCGWHLSFKDCIIWEVYWTATKMPMLLCYHLESWSLPHLCMGVTCRLQWLCKMVSSLWNLEALYYWSALNWININGPWTHEYWWSMIYEHMNINEPSNAKH